MENTIKKPLFIDLTDCDDEYPPPPKKILINNRNQPDVVEVSVNLNGLPGPTSSMQAGRSLGARPKKRGSCSKCYKDESHISIVYLECGHRLCYLCFVLELQNNKKSSTRCSFIDCQHHISQKLIKQVLMPADYVLFLEHTCNNLRRALQKKSNGLDVYQATPMALQPVARASSRIDDIADLSEFDDLSAFDDLGDFNDVPDADRSEIPDVINDLPANLQTQVVNPKIFERRRSELFHIQNLEKESYVKNQEPFECPICMVEYGAGDGVILKNCLHTFCKECICESIKHSGDTMVICPFNSETGNCEFFIQDREIRALTSPEVYEAFLNRALKQGEANLTNVFHCKTPDCIGFIEFAQGTKAFPCEVCHVVNCVLCKAIHELKTCEEYQFDLKNDVKNQEELKLTEEAVKDLVENGAVRQIPFPSWAFLIIFLISL